MNYYYLVLFFIIGCICGSFFCVVGDRLPKGESIIKPRSHCSSCKHILKWYELIPVISYIIQFGKCRNCGKRLSIFYPISEIMSGLLFSISFFVFGFSYQLIFSLLISSFLIIVMVSDVSYLIIPDEITIFFSVVTIIFEFVFLSFRQTFLSLLSGVLMFCLMYCIMMIGNKIFKKETMGGADIKLMFFVGLLLPPSLSLFTIFISSFIALPVSLILLIKDKNNVIPYGPFILIGMFLIYCFS